MPCYNLLFIFHFSSKKKAKKKMQELNQPTKKTNLKLDFLEVRPILMLGLNAFKAKANQKFNFYKEGVGGKYG
jgi:hypothetical protein